MNRARNIPPAPDSGPRAIEPYTSEPNLVCCPVCEKDHDSAAEMVACERAVVAAVQSPTFRVADLVVWEEGCGSNTISQVGHVVDVKGDKLQLRDRRGFKRWYPAHLVRHWVEVVS